jgi:hypothetical protein
LAALCCLFVAGVFVGFALLCKWIVRKWGG